MYTRVPLEATPGIYWERPANGPRRTLTSATLKSRSNQKPGYHVIYELKMNMLEMVLTVLIEYFIFAIFLKFLTAPDFAYF
jgi:hypothetical protein